MDYQRIYNQLVERAQSRILEGYKEKHHILPKCMGGNNSKENLVELTAREHFLFHVLLCEIYPKNIKLYQALWLMSTNKNKKEGKRYKVSSRVYERIKIIASKIYKNRIRTPKEKQKLSQSQKYRWLDKRKEQGLIINKIYINSFIELYPNINLTENSKHCINYCYNNNISIENIICLCNNGVKRFQNYTKGYNKYCCQKCANSYNKEISLHTKENNGLWNNSKKRLRKKEIENLSTNEVELLRRNRIRIKHQGKTKSGHSKALPIIQLDLNSNFIKEWPSIRQAGIKLANTSGETIRKCCKNMQKSAYGYKWQYK